MSQSKESVHPHTAGLRASTEVLTRGFDPRLSVGSARPAVFRSSTYVFSSPEAAERAFSVASGKSKAAEGENVELIYARLNHPNAEIVEDQMVPLEAGAKAAAVFNSGMAAIMTAMTIPPERIPNPVGWVTLKIGIDATQRSARGASTSSTNGTTASNPQTP